MVNLVLTSEKLLIFNLSIFYFAAYIRYAVPMIVTGDRPQRKVGTLHVEVDVSKKPNHLLGVSFVDVHE